MQLRWTWCNWGAGAAAGGEEAVQSPAPKVTSSLLNCHSLLMMMMMMMMMMMVVKCDDFRPHHQHQFLALSNVYGCTEAQSSQSCWWKIRFPVQVFPSLHLLMPILWLNEREHETIL